MVRRAAAGRRNLFARWLARRSSVALVVDNLLATLGLYGATLAVAFIAGMFPVVSIEVFLVGVTVGLHVETAVLVALIGIAALGHQIAKTVTYYAGAGAFELPRGQVRARIEAAKHRIDRWNRRPRLVMLAAAATGLPPLYLLGFIAQPLMKMQLRTFTALCLAGRVGRYATLVAVARLF
jgi:membrane protein YqaA with SNARE-associated domain